jgi:hypothetical protein
MTLIITQTPTHAYHRLPQPLPVIQTLDELMELQDQVDCDLYISMPDEYGQRRVMFLDPL